jgi:hypothetical protein
MHFSAYVTDAIRTAALQAVDEQKLARYTSWQAPGGSNPGRRLERHQTTPTNHLLLDSTNIR